MLKHMFLCFSWMHSSSQTFLFSGLSSAFVNLNSGGVWEEVIYTTQTVPTVFYYQESTVVERGPHLEMQVSFKVWFEQLCPSEMSADIF